jgi:hypothetical protein
VHIQCKPKDVQSLQSSYFLVFYHFGFETTTLTFSRIIDFPTNLHIWKEHVEIDQITNFHEKIIWQSQLYRIPLTAWLFVQR